MYREDYERRKKFTRRALILAGAQLGMIGVLGGRLYQLQVLEADRFKTLADDNRINMKLLVPPRGRIFDRNGKPLAVNRMIYRVLLTAERTEDVAKTLKILAKLIGTSPLDVKRILAEVGRRRNFVPVTVKDNLEWEMVAGIEVNAPDLPGISIEADQTREYPHAREVSHLLGYVAPPPPDSQDTDPLLELPGFRVGKTGIERQFDLTLRGKAGASQLEVNALGRVIRELERKEGVAGDDIVLTVDLDLQRFARKRLSSLKSAASVVLDVERGDVLTLCSVPGYNPNDFNKGLSREDWEAIKEDIYDPLINKSISGLYAPGSTFKMLVGLAALKYKLISPQDAIFCPGHFTLGMGKFHCWMKNGHGPVSMKQALQQSCDVYFYELANRIGVERIAKMASILGLGQLTGIDLPGEKSGLVPTRSWKQKTLGKSWQGGETILAGIGQGFVLSTPLQLAVMTARLATGREIKPHLLRALISGEEIRVTDRPLPPKLKINPRHLEVIKSGMDAAVNTPRGTGWGARISERKNSMAGKTGTSQVRRISSYERETGIIKNEELPWKDRDHSLFVAFAPVKKPKLAISVIAEHGGSGSKVAAPVARDILEEAFKRNLLTASSRKN